MAGRRVCPACGASFHVEHIPPKKEGICDRCGAELIIRDDDKEETVMHRLSVYHAQTSPLIEYYGAKNLVVDIDGTMPVDDVFNAIVEKVGE